jgi:hypothetical protein
VFRLVMGFIEHLQCYRQFTHSAVNYSTHKVFSVCCIVTGCRLVTASNVVASSASVFTSLLAYDCLITNSQTGGHLTPTSYSSHCRFVITVHRHGLHRQHRFQQFFYCCITWLSNGLHREHNFRVTVYGHYLATAFV